MYSEEHSIPLASEERSEHPQTLRYQDKTPFLRPLLNEIQDQHQPACIVLRYLDSDLLIESNKKLLSRPEIKQVAKNILEALSMLHRDGLAHT
ncbi:hypothetical protein AAE478_010660, partial [Parahypoxylon ruwenzoriense]